MQRMSSSVKEAKNEKRIWGLMQYRLDLAASTRRIGAMP